MRISPHFFLACIIPTILSVSGNEIPHKFEGSSELVQVKYHMGPVLSSTVTIYPIWYGTWKESQKLIIRDFINSISEPNSTVSKWWNTVELYTDQSGAKTSTRMVIGSEQTDSRYSFGKYLKRIDMQHIIRRKITSPRKPLPVDSKSGVYLILTSADVMVEDFCNQICGFHFYTFPSIVGSILPYAWVGNSIQQCPTLCSFPFSVPRYMPYQPSKSPNGDIGVEGMVNIIGHELVEIATDPFMNGWYAGDDPASPTEIADLCLGIFGSGGGGSYPGRMLTDNHGATYNMEGNGRKFLVQWIWNPNLRYCRGPNAID